LKIGLPKIRFTRKVLFISVGMLAVLAGSGAAALYVGAGDSLLKSEPVDSPIGGECTTIQTMVLKTPSKRLWMRKFIRMDHAEGGERIRTALRVAGLLAKANSVDLIQVSVLDASGPTLRSQMRGRAIGAEVVIALQPKYLPDMKEPFIVRYFEGMPGEDGFYYGERVSLEVPEIQKLMGAMKSVPDKQDCTEPEKPADAAAKNDHGAKPKHGEPVVKEATHGEKPAAHGEEPAKEGHEASAKEDANSEGHAPAAAEEPSFLDSVLGMVGLGGSEEKPAENHEAKAEDDGAEGHQPAEAAKKEHGPSVEEDASAEGHAPDKAAEPSFFDSVLDMVGLGGSEEKPTENHEAKAEDDGAAVTDDAIEPAYAAEDHASEPAEKHEAVPADTDANAAGHQPVKATEAADEHAEDKSQKNEDHATEAKSH
jgi:hypothetical protein